jgi:hypothetical protein
VRDIELASGRQLAVEDVKDGPGRQLILEPPKLTIIYQIILNLLDQYPRNLAISLELWSRTSCKVLCACRNSSQCDCSQFRRRFSTFLPLHPPHPLPELQSYTQNDNCPGQKRIHSPKGSAPIHVASTHKSVAHRTRFASQMAITKLDADQPARRLRWQQQVKAIGNTTQQHMLRPTSGPSPPLSAPSSLYLHRV